MTPTLTQAVELFMAIHLLAVGVSHMLRPTVWARFFVGLRDKDEVGVFVLGFLTLGFGTFIVALHNVWHGLPLVLTIYGWLQVLKGLIYFTFPRLGLRALATISVDRPRGFVIAGAFLFGLGALLSFHLFHS